MAGVKQATPSPAVVTVCLGLSDPTRLKLLARIGREEVCVCDLSPSCGATSRPSRAIWRCSVNAASSNDARKAVGAITAARRCPLPSPGSSTWRPHPGADQDGPAAEPSAKTSHWRVSSAYRSPATTGSGRSLAGVRIKSPILVGLSRGPKEERPAPFAQPLSRHTSARGN
jgi:hypothetical protein